MGTIQFLGRDRREATGTNLLLLVDEDTRAFDRIMAAMGLPKGSDAEKAARKAAMTRSHQGCHPHPAAHHAGVRGEHGPDEGHGRRKACQPV
jgi:hypothetical protein